MNATVPCPARSHHPVLFILGLSFVLVVSPLAFIVYGVTGYVRLGRDAGALRNSVLKSAATAWDKKIEVNVGSFTVNLARAGLRLAKLDANAHAALQSVRAAEVGVYQLKDGCRHPNHATMLGAADDAMERRGWERLVAVLDRHELVAVYVPKAIRSERDVTFCLVVLRGRDLVVASARGNLEPLIELARNLPEWRHARQALASFPAI